MGHIHGLLLTLALIASNRNLIRAGTKIFEDRGEWNQSSCDASGGVPADVKTNFVNSGGQLNRIGSLPLTPRDTYINVGSSQKTPDEYRQSKRLGEYTDPRIGNRIWPPCV